jgi:integrase
MEPTAKVIVRHALKCPDRKKGSDWRRCDCRKSVVVYDGTTRTKDGRLTNRIISAETRSWSKAEKFAQAWLDQFDPDKQELKMLRAEKVQQQVRIEEAVALYCADLIARLGDNGTVAMARSLLGHINPDTKVVESDGHLFAWLDKQLARPTFIAEITPTHLTEWRASWRFGSDLTAAQRWSMVKGFFRFCEAQGWIDDSPARKLKPLGIAKGNRTAVFTDEQYAAVLDAVSIYDPENVPAATRKGWQQRLTIFVELLRWSGMDLIDACQWRPEVVDAEAVLRYRRQKTKVLATVPMPDHVAVMLREIPLDRDSVGPNQPFRSRNATPGSDTRRWQNRLDQLFKLAGITAVQTEHGRVRRPHPKMFRDTFAVGHLRNGVSIHSVAKMMGHTKTETTERAYLPWVKELETAHIAAVRNTMVKPKASRGRKVVSITAN